MRKTRLLALAMSLLMATVAVGCKTPDDEVTVSDETLQITVVAKGYGADFVRELARMFTRKTNIDARVVLETPDDSVVENSLRTGPKRNKTDLYFVITNRTFGLLAQRGTVVPGYDPVWADLSDVYESELTGYAESAPGVKIKDYIEPAILEGLTYKDGKQYSVPWTTGVTTMLYNKTLLDATNEKLAAKGAEPLAIPRTTGEMFELFDRIKALKAEKVLGDTVYPYVYSGSDDYTPMAVSSWWAQYDGKAAFDDMLAGKYAGSFDKGYNAFGTNGKKYALATAKRLLAPENLYHNPNDVTKIFTNAQLDFLRGKAFFSCNGDWLERESSNSFNPGEADVAFMKVPVVSELVEHTLLRKYFTGTQEEKEEKLRAVIAYIDEHPVYSADAEVEGISGSVLRYLYDVRAIYQNDGTQYTALVPAYAAHVDAAKDFLKYMLSKEGQEVVMEAAYGIAAPLRVDCTQFDYYDESTYLFKSKMKLFSEGLPIGETKAQPMSYLGGLTLFRLDGESMANSFGVAGKDVNSIVDAEVAYYESVWKDMRAKAGV